MDILENLNPEQQRAVQAIEGPVLVLAGAGSGKTRTLTHRIAYLIGVKHVLPSRILAVTFTNKAAQEMKERVRRLLSQDYASSKSVPFIGTFHSVCARILREEAGMCGLTSHFTILDAGDQLRVVKQVLKNLQLSPAYLHPKKVVSYIDHAKQELVAPSHFRQVYKDVLKPPLDALISSVYEKYQKHLQSSNAVDFGDLLCYVVFLWRENPEILKKYQRRFQYILVDEYQDTNSVQYEFCHLLAREHKNLFVVGDDYQSIYSFRGARIENILNFSKDHPLARQVILEQNYRSTEPVLKVANAVIAQNRFQQKKVLWTEHKGGNKPKIVEVMDEGSEAGFVAEIAMGHGTKRALKGFAPFKDLNNFVVLYRTNAQSRVIEEALLGAGIPYRIIGGARFYDRKEIKDILGYLRIILNPTDVISLERVINVPPRGIGQKTWESLKPFLRGERRSSSSRTASFFALLETLAKKSAGMSISELVDEVVAATGYEDFLKATEENVDERMGNIEELKSIALRFGNMRGRDALSRFLEDVALVSDIDALDAQKNALTLMTVHAAKGLEFDTVCMVGMEQGLFPYSSSLLNQEELEEERRLCYVGITRVRKELYFTHTRSRTLYGETRYPEPSEFIAELKDELVERIAL